MIGSYCRMSYSFRWIGFPNRDRMKKKIFPLLFLNETGTFSMLNNFPNKDSAYDVTHLMTIFLDHGIYRVLHIYLPPFGDSSFLSKLTKKRFIYLFRKLWVVAVKTSYEIGSKSLMKSSRWVLVKVVGLFFLHWTLKTRYF